MRFVDKDQIKQVGRRDGDLLDMGADAWHRRDYHVKLSQSLPLERISHPPGGCHDLWVVKIGRQRAESLQNSEFLKVVGDLLAYQTARCQHQNPFGLEQEGAGL